MSVEMSTSSTGGSRVIPAGWNSQTFTPVDSVGTKGKIIDNVNTAEGAVGATVFLKLHDAAAGIILRQCAVAIVAITDRNDR